MNVRAAPRRALRAARRAGNRLVNLFDPPILVLAYHRVADLTQDPQSLAVHPERFRAQLRFLRRHYELLRLEDSWPRVEKPAAIVTFDDGYADNATAALPILEEENVPATFFVSVGAVESGGEFWWDELERWLLTDASLPNPLEIDTGADRHAWPTKTPEDRRSLYDALHARLRAFRPALRARLLEELRVAADGAASPRPSHRPLTTAEIARLAQSRWASVGAHGVSHTPFATLSLEEQREELRTSRERLQSWSGADVATFSFPFGGRRDFTRDSVRLAREAGFRRVAANAPGQIHRWSDPFVVPRFLVRDWDEERFASELYRFQTA
ncbi:MAG TPA: polysaccharide deacetylase family protein [Candidatus Dormibacteraeota bacterium]|nr:polysaccharide deacetylase family protein [Candidatus Dormibacteraeota bacterium]